MEFMDEEGLSFGALNCLVWYMVAYKSGSHNHSFTDTFILTKFDAEGPFHFRSHTCLQFNLTNSHNPKYHVDTNSSSFNYETLKSGLVASVLFKFQDL